MELIRVTIHGIGMEMLLQFTDVDSTVEMVQVAHDDCKNDHNFMKHYLKMPKNLYILVVETLQSCLH